MNSQKLIKFITAMMLAMLLVVGFGPMMTASAAGPPTDVVITKVETGDDAADMTLEDLAGGVNVATYFTDGKVIPGVSFTYYSVTEAQLATMTANPSAYGAAAAVETFTGATGVRTAETNASGQVTLPNLAEGFYWIIENTKGTIASSTAVPFALTLPFTNLTGDGYLETIYVYPKNTLEDLPTIDKEVGNSNAAIGQLNNWSILMDIPVGIEDYVEFGFIDEIDARLDFEAGSVTPTAPGVTFNAADYVITFDTSTATGNYGSLQGKPLSGTLSVYFTEAGRNKLADATGNVVTINFQTRINETAIMGQDIFNNVILDYDNGHGYVADPDRDHPPEEPFVHTGGKAFLKVNQATEAPLDDAEFKITNATGQYVIVGANGAITFGTEAQGTTFTSENGGEFEVKGLPYGEYVLIETKAPAGYALPTQPNTPFTVNAGSYYLDPTEIEVGTADSDNLMTIFNMQMTIPQTGGIGTATFTIIGALFMILSVVYYKKTDKA